MSAKIDSRAMVSPNARLGKNVTVGPYATIGDNVVIGDDCVIDSFAQILGYTQIGSGNRIFSYAVVGNIPQDLKYKGDKSFLILGNNNKIREFVTVNPGTNEGTKTIIGSNNLVMAYSHIAHDCVIGDGNVLANGATLAGYVTMGNKGVIGGLVAVHQFCRLGDFSIVGGCSKVVQDIPPFSMCDGHPAKICGLNIIGLKRAKFGASTVRLLKKAFKILFFENHPFNEAKKIAKEELSSLKELDYIIDFISSSKRGMSA